MSQARVKETVSPLRLILPEPSPPGLGRAGARCAASCPQRGDDLIPYSARELKYLWIRWDEAQRHRHPGLRYRHIYAGALGVILAGWFIYGMGLSLSAPLGGILALAGTFVGGWYYLKSLFH
jgi:hypothetical protein